MTARDTDLFHRVLRFLTTVGWPVTVAIVERVQPWLIFAVLGAILAFLGDEGGTSLRRLGYMTIGPAGLVAGAAVGTATGSPPALFFTFIFFLGLVYCPF